MKKLLGFHFLIVCLFLLSNCESNNPSVRNSKNANASINFVSNPQALNKILDKYIDEGYYPFVYARLEDLDGNVLYEHGKANQQLLPNTEINGDSYVRIWSMSKIITISTVLDLIEDGLLKMEDPVTKYIYTIELNAKFIVKEKLIYYPKSQPALIFNREFNEAEEVSLIEFGAKLNLTSKQTIILEGNTIKNSTLLSVYNKSNVNIEEFELVVNWFKKNFMEMIKPKTNLTSWTRNEIKKSEKCKDFILDILQKADFNISDIIIEEKEENIDDELAELIKGVSRISDSHKEKLLSERILKLKRISFMHSTNSGDFKIPMNLQSNGTTRYFGLGGILNTLLEEEKLLSIDELETSLHYELVSHFLKTFLVNSTNSQLIVTTHNINILMEDFIRRDVVWFCEKDEGGATKLFSASDFKIHKNISLFNAYKIGKLGAKPNLGNIYLEPSISYSLEF